MKIRLTACCFALIAALSSVVSLAQDCAPCAASADISCPSCAPCAGCTGASCELFGGLRSLLACRPCVMSCATVAPCATPACTTTPACGPIVSCNLPSCDVPCDSCDVCAPAICCGPMFPYLKPCLYNAVHRPINGVCKIVHGAFSALANVTTPTSDCGFFKPAYVCDITCGSCATCDTCEAAPVPACTPAAPACK